MSGNQVDKPHASAIPPYLRHGHSHTSSVSSYHSTTSHGFHQPLPQQHQYVPSFDAEGLVGTGLQERALFDDFESRSRAGTPTGTPPRTPMAHHDEAFPAPPDTFSDIAQMAWNEAREGSIARRPRWRRPSPKWVFPFLVTAAVSMGMAAPPKSELMINLACLAHPPEQRQTLSADSIFVNDIGVTGELATRWQGQGIHSVANSALASTYHLNTTRPLSPADEWFIHLQHGIHSYRLSHQKSYIPTNSGKSRTSSHERTGPVPRPGGPLDQQGDDTAPEKAGGNGPFEGIDPQMCKKDPKVQAASAELVMTLTLMMGILSALTTGFWGQTSDRLGRTKVMSLSIVGLLLNELTFVIVATYPHLVPGGYYALLVGPTLDGLLGGMSTLTATVNAYLSDVTPEGSRVTVFARAAGILMGGYATGPVLGSLLIQSTGNIMAPFYLNIIIQSINFPLIFFLLPESLSSDARLILAKNAALAKEAAARRHAAEREWENTTPGLGLPSTNNGEGATESDPLLSGWSINSHTQSRTTKRFIGNARRTFYKTFSFLSPLAIFLPTIGEDPSSGRKVRRWNMTAVGAGLFFMSTVVGVMQTKTQYAFFAYGWTSAQLGPYMSFVAYLRSLVLIVVVPLIMRQVKSRLSKSPPAVPDEVPDDSAISVTSDITTPDPPPIPHPSQQSSLLGLWTIRVCLSLELIPWILLGLGQSETGFIILSGLIALGSPGMPAANSLALSLLPDPSQSGRLFGALSVIHAIGATLISPLMFGTLFASSVGTYAPALFLLAATCVACALLSVSFVRLGKKPEEGERGAGRGRSRIVKRVNSTSVYGASGVTMRSEYASATASGSGISRVG